MGMKKNATDNAVFVFRFDTELLFLLSNVDDFLILSSSKDLFLRVKEKLSSMFDLTSQEDDVIKFLNLQVVSSSIHRSDEAHN